MLAGVMNDVTDGVVSFSLETADKATVTLELGPTPGAEDVVTLLLEVAEHNDKFTGDARLSLDEARRLHVALTALLYKADGGR